MPSRNTTQLDANSEQDLQVWLTHDSLGALHQVPVVASFESLLLLLQLTLQLILTISNVHSCKSNK